jgi:phosphoserine aminotransferase
MINLKPGPSQLFHSVRDHVRQAFKLRIPELSPTSDEGRELVRETARQLRELLSIPDSHDIFFLPETSSFIDEAIRRAGNDSSSWLPHDALSSDGFTVNGKAKFLALRHTEEGGTSIPSDWLMHVRERSNGGLVAVDASLAWPYASLPFQAVDAILLEFHLGFGLPAGLGAAVVNGRWMQYHSEVGSSYTTIHPSLNLTWVFVLRGVVGDMLSRGIMTLRRETEYKSSLLYHLLDQHPSIKPAVKDKSMRARTVVAAQSGDINRVQDELRKHAISAGFTGNAVLFANFPSHSKEQYERLTDILSAIR